MFLHLQFSLNTKIDIKLFEGQMLQANFGVHQIKSVQSLSVGNDESHPETFDYFLASMLFCVYFYIRKFVRQEPSVQNASALPKDIATIDDDR